MIPHVHRFHFCLLACLVAIGLLVVVVAVDLTAATITEKEVKKFPKGFLRDAEKLLKSVKQLGGSKQHSQKPSIAQLAELGREADNLIERLDPVEKWMRGQVQYLYNKSIGFTGATEKDKDKAFKEGARLTGQLVKLNQPVCTARALLLGWELHEWDGNPFTKVTLENAVEQAGAFIKTAASADGMSPETRKQHAKSFITLLDADRRMLLASNWVRVFILISGSSLEEKLATALNRNAANVKLHKINVLREELDGLAAQFIISPPQSAAGIKSPHTH